MMSTSKQRAMFAWSATPTNTCSLKRPEHDVKLLITHAPPTGDGWKGALPAVLVVL